jgi:hypothetical protein
MKLSVREFMELARRFCRCHRGAERPVETVRIMFGSMENTMAKATLRVGGPANLGALILLDSKGNVRAPEGVPEWALASDTIASLEVSPDGLSAKLTPLDVGVTSGTVKVDVRSGPDVVEKLGVFDVEVLPGDIETIDVQFTEEPTP